MKRMTKIAILISLVFAFAGIAMGGFTHSITEKPNAWWGTGGTKDTLWNWGKEVESYLDGATGTGKVFFVDSGEGDDTYDGTSPAKAKATIDAAVGLCTANRGDVIYVMQGHNEAVGAAADDIDFDVAGITVVGIGRGTLKPTLDYDGDVAQSVHIGAGNITLANLRFRVSAADVNQAIFIDASGDGFAIVNCDFGYAETATDEFVYAIDINGVASDGLIKGCMFKAGGAAAVGAINIDAAVVGLTIEDNIMYGDYSTAVIYGQVACDDLIIRHNILFNGTMGGDGELNNEPAIEVADSTAGFVLDNRIVSDVATGLAMRVADDMVFMNNYISDTDGDEYSGTKEDDAASITAHADG